MASERAAVALRHAVRALGHDPEAALAFLRAELQELRAVGDIDGVVALARDAGTRAFANEDYSAAAILLEELTALQPDDPYALCGLGMALQRMGRIAEARRSFERCIVVSATVDPEMEDAMRAHLRDLE